MLHCMLKPGHTKYIEAGEDTEQFHAVGVEHLMASSCTLEQVEWPREETVMEVIIDGLASNPQKVPILVATS